MKTVWDDPNNDFLESLKNFQKIYLTFGSSICIDSDICHLPKRMKLKY